MAAQDQSPKDTNGALMQHSESPLVGRIVGYAPSEPSPYFRNELSEADAFHHYSQILWQRRYAILAWAASGVLAAVILTLCLPPEYRAKAVVEVQSLNEDFLNMKNVNPTAPGAAQSPEFNVRTQAMLLQSRPVLERALDQANLESRLVTLNQQGSRSFLRFGRTSAEANPSRTRESALAALMSQLNVRNEAGTSVIEVTFESKDRQLASDVVNAVTSGFIDHNQERRWQSSQAISSMLSRQLQDVKSKLQRTEATLQAYVAQSNLTILAGKDNVAEERLRQMQLEISKAQADRVVKQSQRELAAKASAESLPEVLDDPTLKDYQVNLTDLRRQLAEISSTLTQEHPRVLKLQAQIALIESARSQKRSNILSRINNDHESALRRERLLVADYNTQINLLSRQSDKVEHFLTLKREVDTTRQLYDALFQRVKEAGLASAMRASDISIVEPAVPPTHPYKPSMPLNVAIGLLGGLCIGGTLAIGRAQMDNRIEQPGELSWHVRVPELGVVPKWEERDSRFRQIVAGAPLKTLSAEVNPQLELSTWEQWPSAFSESFRCILTSILLAEKNGTPLHTIAITSANPGEGKTSVVCNLSIALARINRRVLLVDGDMRRPRLHKIFQVSNFSGLAEMLDGKEYFGVLETKVPNLSLLTSGSSPDERLLFSRRLTGLLDRFRREFDIVVVDTPPVLMMSDARMISRHVDAAILVVAQHTPKDSVMLAAKHLLEDGSTLIGTILNNWDPKAARHPGYYKYDYYGANS